MMTLSNLTKGLAIIEEMRKDFVVKQITIYQNQICQEYLQYSNDTNTTVDEDMKELGKTIQTVDEAKLTWQKALYFTVIQYHYLRKRIFNIHAEFGH